MTAAIQIQIVTCRDGRGRYTFLHIGREGMVRKTFANVIGVRPIHFDSAEERQAAVMLHNLFQGEGFKRLSDKILDAAIEIGKRRRRR